MSSRPPAGPTPRKRTSPAGQVHMLARGATLACAVCGRRGLFRRWVHMVPECPRCGLVFERQEGMFVGAVGINTILNFGIMFFGFVTFLAVTWPDLPGGLWPLYAAIAFIPVPIILYPFSKTLWLAIDLLMRPATEDELRPRDEWGP